MISDSARASILPFGYRIPCRCESALYLAFLVRDLCLARLCLSSHILFGIECMVADKSGHAVDRLGRPPFALEDLSAFRVHSALCLWSLLAKLAKSCEKTPLFR